MPNFKVPSTCKKKSHWKEAKDFSRSMAGIEPSFLGSFWFKNSIKELRETIHC